MKKAAADFKKDLKKLGISNQAIDAVWPTWWSDEAETSRSAQVELRFTVARRLGLAPTSIIGEDEPSFVWKHEAKFKGLSNYGGTEQAALSSFGISLARTLAKGISEPSGENVVGQDPDRIRQAILANAPFVRLQDVCAVCWGLRIPVLHLRVFPLSAKNMVAMAVRSGDQAAILVGKDATYPAPTAYHIAHELGHISSGHLAENQALVDLEEPLQGEGIDKEEIEADQFALRLLTGSASPKIEVNAAPNNGAELANAVVQAANARRIEPGTLAMCYGYQTSNWPIAYAALARVYQKRSEVWKFLNKIANRQLDWTSYSDDEEAYLKAVMGAVELA